MIQPADDEIVFYTNPPARGRIGRWMLEEIGCPWRTVVLDFGTTMKASEYLAVSSMGKAPAVTWRGVPVTDARRLRPAGWRPPRSGPGVGVRRCGLRDLPALAVLRRPM